MFKFGKVHLTYGLIALVFFIALITHFTNYNEINSINLEWIGFKSFLLWVAQFFSLCILISYIYQCWDITRRFYFALGIFDVIFIFILGILTFFFLPLYIYLNFMMIMANIFVVFHHDLISVVPDLQFSDFWVNCMQSQDKETSGGYPKLPVPSPNGHVVVIGVHEGKNYACVDTIAAIDKCFSSELVKSSANFTRKAMKIGDIVCSGLPNNHYSSPPLKSDDNP